MTVLAMTVLATGLFGDRTFLRHVILATGMLEYSALPGSAPPANPLEHPAPPAKPLEHLGSLNDVLKLCAN